MPMLKLTRKKFVLFFLFAFLFCLPPLAEILDQNYLIPFFRRCLIYGIAAVSLDLILGYGGMVSLGHAAFFGMGTYGVGILAFHYAEGTPFLSWPVEIPGSNDALLAWPVSIVVTALFALVIGALSLRTSGVYFLMITLAFAQMLFFFFISLETYGGDDGMSMYERNTLFDLDLNNDTTFYYICFAFLLLFVLFSHRLIHARFGMVLQGCEQNEQRMKTLGFPTYIYKLTAFTISGAGAGLAGILMSNHLEYVSPDLLHWTQSGEILIMVVLGGMGTLFGAVFGAIAFLSIEEILSAYTEHWMLYFGPFLILVVLFSKRGLYGLFIGEEEREHG